MPVSDPAAREGAAQMNATTYRTGERPGTGDRVRVSRTAQVTDYGRPVWTPGEAGTVRTGQIRGGKLRVDLDGGATYTFRPADLELILQGPPPPVTVALTPWAQEYLAGTGLLCGSEDPDLDPLGRITLAVWATLDRGRITVTVDQVGGLDWLDDMLSTVATGGFPTAQQRSGVTTLERIRAARMQLQREVVGSG
jgi:hypothetical protein